MRELLFIALVVACPLMMMMMMRGGHGHGGGGAGHEHKTEPRETSTNDLRRQRADLDRLIDEREGSEYPESNRELTTSGGDRQ